MMRRSTACGDDVVIVARTLPVPAAPMNAISASTMRLLVSNIPTPAVSSFAELDGVLRLLGRLDNA